MNIKTKFGIHQKCYFLADDRINEGVIDTLEIYYKDYGKKTVKYQVSNIMGSSVQVFDESDLFKSINEVLEFLKENIQ